MTGLRAAVVIGCCPFLILVSGCQANPKPGDTREIITVQLLDFEPSGEVLRLNRSDVAAEAPPFITAIEKARTNGRAEIAEPDEVRTTWTYLDQIRGREVRAATYVELDSDNFEVAQFV